MFKLILGAINKHFNFLAYSTEGKRKMSLLIEKGRNREHWFNTESMFVFEGARQIESRLYWAPEVNANNVNFDFVLNMGEGVPYLIGIELKTAFVGRQPFTTLQNVIECDHELGTVGPFKLGGDYLTQLVTDGRRLANAELNERICLFFAYGKKDDLCNPAPDLETNLEAFRNDFDNRLGDGWTVEQVTPDPPQENHIDLDNDGLLLILAYQIKPVA